MIIFIKELFINSCIMCTLLFACHQLIYNKKQLLSYHIGVRTKPIDRFKIGLLAGIFGCTLILFKISIFDQLAIDYRNVALVLAALTGGPLALWITGTILALFRLLAFGLSTASVAGFISIIIAMVLCQILMKYGRQIKTKWVILFGTSSLSTLIAVMIIMIQTEYFVEAIVTFAVLSIIGGYSAYTMYSYLLSIQEAYASLKEGAYIDGLTGLYNRRYFDEYMRKRVLIEQKQSMIYTLMLFDIDHFKYVNDTYGHQSGDKVLIQLAEICKKCMGEPFKVFRVGGEEFAVLMPHTSSSRSYAVAEKFRKKVERHTFVIDKEEVLSITISIGLATYPTEVASPYDLYEKADEALYKSKNNGRNQVTCYQEKILINEM